MPTSLERKGGVGTPSKAEDSGEGLTAKRSNFIGLVNTSSLHLSEGTSIGKNILDALYYRPMLLPNGFNWWNVIEVNLETV
jgi:hypothetical protein